MNKPDGYKIDLLPSLSITSSTSQPTTHGKIDFNMRWQYLSLIFASVASASNAARFNEMGNTHKEFTNELNSRQLTSDSCDCSGTKPNSTTGVGYICHDRRLGPTCLPRIWPLLSLVSDYNRFGRLTPGEFLKKWTYPEGSIDSSTNKPNAGKWHYPEHDGFQLDINNKSMAGDMTLLPGTLVDRFGYESGTVRPYLRLFVQLTCVECRHIPFHGRHALLAAFTTPAKPGQSRPTLDRVP